MIRRRGDLVMGSAWAVLGLMAMVAVILLWSWLREPTADLEALPQARLGKVIDQVALVDRHGCGLQLRDGDYYADLSQQRDLGLTGLLAGVLVAVWASYRGLRRLGRMLPGGRPPIGADPSPTCAPGGPPPSA